MNQCGRNTNKRTRGQTREETPKNNDDDNNDNNNKERRLTCFVRAGIDGIGSDGGEGSLCAVLGSDRFLLIFHSFQCFELLGMFRAFVVGRSLAIGIKSQLANAA